MPKTTIFPSIQPPVSGVVDTTGLRTGLDGGNCPDTFSGLFLTMYEVRAIYRAKERVKIVAQRYDTSTAVVLRIKLRTDPRYFHDTVNMGMPPLSKTDRDGRLQNYTPSVPPVVLMKRAYA